MKYLVSILLVVLLSSCTLISKVKHLGRFSMDSEVKTSMDSSGTKTLDTSSKKEVNQTKESGLQVSFAKRDSSRPCPENKVVIEPDGRIWASGAIESATLQGRQTSSTRDSSGKKESQWSDLNKDSAGKLVVKTIDRNHTVTKRVIPWWCYLIGALGLLAIGWLLYQKLKPRLLSLTLFK